MSTGVVYVAIGDKAQQEVKASSASLAKFNPDLPTAFYPETKSDTPVQLSRIAKLTLFDWSPFNYTLYLDADTRVFGDVSVGFEILKDGYDMVITPSSGQGKDVLWHIDGVDKEETFDTLCTRDILQLQAGVFFVARNDRTEKLFDVWRAEWDKFHNQDQGALLRALQKAPVKLWLFGRPWNDHRRSKRAVIEHWFGRARG